MNLHYLHSVTLVFFLNFVHCFSGLNIIDSPLLTQKIGTNRTIIVDINGGGHFKSIQAAIDHIPNDNSHWIIIHIMNGVYREKVNIPKNKPYIFMKGNGRGKPSIAWSQSSFDNYVSATFVVEAPHFVAYGISFKNIAPTHIAHTSETKSVAAFVGGDMAAFYNCAFFSNYNTLFDAKGRHYYDNCYIQGSTDFIFGHGQAIFHECEVFVNKNRKDNNGGSITAHHRESSDEDTGFVFVKGKVYGTRDDVYLGRAGGPHSRVVFADTYLSRTVIPHGWSNTSYGGTTENVFQAEYNNHGPGSESKTRAPWSKQLRDKEAAPFLSIDFIKGAEWLPAWF